MGRYLVFTSVGFELMGLILGCYYLGQLLDQRFQTGGLIFAISSFIALIAWLVRVIWLIKKFQSEDEKNSHDSSSDA